MCINILASILSVLYNSNNPGSSYTYYFNSLFCFHSFFCIIIAGLLNIFLLCFLSSFLYSSLLLLTNSYNYSLFSRSKPPFNMACFIRYIFSAYTATFNYVGDNSTHILGIIIVLSFGLYNYSG